MTTLNWLNNNGFYSQVNEYMINGNEKPLFRALLSLSEEELEDYMSSCHPDDNLNDSFEIINLICEELGMINHDYSTRSNDIEYSNKNKSKMLNIILACLLIVLAMILVFVILPLLLDV